MSIAYHHTNVLRANICYPLRIARSVVKSIRRHCLPTAFLLDFLPVVGEGFSTSGAMEASREMEEQLGMRRKDEKEYKGKEKNKEKKEEVLEEIIKVYDGYNSLRKRLFRTITVSKSATKDELLHASMKAFVVTQVVMALRQNF